MGSAGEKTNSAGFRVQGLRFKFLTSQFAAICSGGMLLLYIPIMKTARLSG